MFQIIKDKKNKKTFKNIIWPVNVITGDCNQVFEITNNKCFTLLLNDYDLLLIWELIEFCNIGKFSSKNRMYKVMPHILICLKSGLYLGHSKVSFCWEVWTFSVEEVLHEEKN